ncbi:MAG TPA: hypothetical protein VKW78_06040 [Terriglobales bacterium]|nr:hypothetical protein [Terriglobales bacterium]
MIPVFFIALNFLRESRWAIAMLLLWAVISGSAAGASIKTAQDDALFFLKQQAVYGVVFTAFLASSAIHNQRRSRRILAVLAKAITRWEYLAGLELGFLIAAAIYCAALAGLGGWVFHHAGLPASGAISLAIMLFAASAVAGSLALLFSTFLNPLFSVALTAILVALNGVLLQFSPVLRQVVPVYELMQSILEFSFEKSWSATWSGIAWAFVQSVLIWAVASAIFARRDVAVVIE